MPVMRSLAFGGPAAVLRAACTAVLLAGCAGVSLDHVLVDGEREAGPEDQGLVSVQRGGARLEVSLPVAP